MKKDLILVFGATGTVGSELIRILKADGQSVRGVSSKPSKNSETVQVNLLTGEGISAAFEGVDKAFLLSPPGYADQYKLLHPLIEEAKKRQLKKVVLMTAFGANADENSPFRRTEVALEKSGLNYNIVRPNWFLQNFNTFWIQGILEQAKILLPAGKAKTSFIDTRDISAVIAKLLTTDTWNNQAYDITGPRALDHDEVARELSLATGKSIRYEDIDAAVLNKGLKSGGVPPDYADFLSLILTYLRLGYNAAVTDDLKKILGREAIDIKSYAQDYKKAWV